MVTAAESLIDGATALNDAVAAYTALTDAIQDKLDLLADWQIAAATTVTIGVDYDTIQEAWDAFKFKQLNADVIIQVPDGDHYIEPTLLADAPFGARIHVRGNLANPAACRLIATWTIGAALPYVISVERCVAEVSGFRLLGNGPYKVACGLKVGTAAVVSSADGSIEVDGCTAGIQATQGATYVGHQPVITGCVRSIEGYDGARLYANDPDITGLGKAWIDPTSGDRSYGIYGSQSAVVVCRGATVSACQIGALSAWSAFLIVNKITVDDCYTGVAGDRGGYLRAGPSDDLTQPATITNCDNGMTSNNLAVLEAPNAVVDSCVVGYQAADLARLMAPDSTATNCSSFGYAAYTNAVVTAERSLANAAGNGTNYNLSSGTPGATGGLLTYS
ncbi:hypothetical protein HDIA_1994 [Hartmannibacter diazotrophicus]|uniref:Uncharacterized protein n=1 Tax=Hartmannibacter diazotrophicus TaxID=1482074 RepID=A0A2C9D7L9_9HYPH|nr:hypothetical protein [Hartmannibacter diazotrophicus]SON55535.1 hypothetical protein HDIA_1994 [Hartmannibacter diazotrophicus]